MIMEPNTLRLQIQSTLQPIDLWSPAAEELLMATCAQESLMGAYRKQVNGPALGIFQMEPRDHDDIWKNYLAFRNQMSADGAKIAGKPELCTADMLEFNDPYAIFMCRIHYLRAIKPLPDAKDLGGLWVYYKAFYNSVNGAATQAEFNRHYQALVKGPAI